MVVRKCPECGHEVSKHHATCPQCGYPMLAEDICGRPPTSEETGQRRTVLVACPECACQISDNLLACPGCGYPLRSLPTASISAAPVSPTPVATPTFRPSDAPTQSSVLPTQKVLVAAGFVGVLVVAIILAALRVGPVSAPSSSSSAQPPNNSRVRQSSDRVRVFVVPGTYGNEGFWPNIIPGKATFASELLATLEPGSEVYPFLWASSVYHEKRVEAAHNLAELIDRDADQFDRVCLVGHSHGGNVALMAAGLCRHNVDTVICLSTPHLYLRTSGADGADLPLPIYCSLRSALNTDHILAISPNTDTIPDTLSNETLTGVTENEAIRLTTGWREALDHPRLANDNLTFRLFESNNVVADKHLPLAYDEKTGDGIVSCSVCSFVRGAIKVHACIHSRRMGHVVGEIIRDRVRPERVESVCRLIQPADEDDGEPVPEAEHRSVVANGAALYEHAGWLLARIEIRLEPKAKEVAGEDAPDPYVRITAPNGKEVYLRTETRWDSCTADWEPDYFFPTGTEVVVQVWDANYVTSDTWLGGRRISLGRNPPPASLSADTVAKVYWSGTLEWVPMHY